MTFAELIESIRQASNPGVIIVSIITGVIANYLFRYLESPSKSGDSDVIKRPLETFIDITGVIFCFLSLVLFFLIYVLNLRSILSYFPTMSQFMTPDFLSKLYSIGLLMVFSVSVSFSIKRVITKESSLYKNVLDLNNLICVFSFFILLVFFLKLISEAIFMRQNNEQITQANLVLTDYRYFYIKLLAFTLSFSLANWLLKTFKSLFFQR